jgi:pimeloyl-ACP methyl ester carboxylesterase
MTLRNLVCGATVLGVLMALPGCRAPERTADLGALYNRAARSSDLERNPVIVIPGILGSRLHDEATDSVVWGAFTGRFANPETPNGARLVALPMARGEELAELRDAVRPAGVLDSLKIRLAGLPLSFAAYRNILAALGVGGFRDQQLGEAGAVDYGDDHYSCFQFAYDWRRDNVENAARLHEFILDRKAYVRAELRKRQGVDRPDLKFDLVAHSMGGLVARYYLRYGDATPPDDGSPPPITWAGSEHVERVILVGTPNAGSASALWQLVNGTQFAPIVPKFEPAILGTMPAIYQLLPRARHGIVRTADGAPVADLLDPELWERHGWGLMADEQASVLEVLLPDVHDPRERRRIARDHLEKSLARARQFQQALDRPATPPAGVELHLVAGDAELTNAVVAVADDGRLAWAEWQPGDGTVTRASALLDERLAGAWTTRLRSPITWRSVRFIFADHLGLTKDAAFTDNLLYLLLEDPR